MTNRLSITCDTAASRWIAANPTPERTIPEGHVRCLPCDGTGTHTFGSRDGQPIEDRCPICRGFGAVRAHCHLCLDRGEWPVMDEEGHDDGIEYCSCAAGHRLAEAEHVDVTKAAHEATLPNYIALSHTAIAAGNEPF